MKNMVTFNVENFKLYIYQVIKSSYIMGLTYAATKPSFSEEEAIKRFQDEHWENLKEFGIVKE